MNLEPENNKDIPETMKKYLNLLEKSADHAVANKEIVGYLSAIAHHIGSVLSALPMVSEFGGAAVERAKQKGMTPEDAFCEIYLEKIREQIELGKLARTKNAALILGFIDVIHKQGMPGSVPKEILEKLQKYAGKHAVLNGSETSSEPEIELMGELNLVSEVINRAKTGEGLPTDETKDRSDTGTQAPARKRSTRRKNGKSGV